MQRKITLFNSLIFLLISLIGCGGKQISLLPIEDEPSSKEVIQDYYLQPGDNLDIKFFNNPELQENVTIRPDGKISLQLIDEVKAAGLTPAQLDELLVQKYSSQLQQTEITVIVRDFGGQKIYVGGAVNNPGIIQMQDRLTALEAIMQAGGFYLETAKVNNVVIIRHKNGKRYGGKLDLRASLKGKESQPFYLQPYDIVYVPRTTIAGINQWIDQHISQIVTLAGFRYTKMGRSYSYGVDTSRD